LVWLSWLTLCVAFTLPDFDAWDRATQKWVVPGVIDGIHLNVIDYANMGRDPDYYRFVRSLADIDPVGYGVNEVYAVFNNAYNALAMGFLIREPCLRNSTSCIPMPGLYNCSGNDGGIWDKIAGVIAGRNWTLNRVELFLRQPIPFAEDPNVHASIVCASVSCPNVRPEAFRPEKVQAQMQDQMRIMVANQLKGFSLDKEKKTVTMSMIFSWFAVDFVQTTKSVLSYLLPYLDTDTAQFVQANMDSLQVKYWPYDWNVNGKLPCNCE